MTPSPTQAPTEGHPQALPLSLNQRFLSMFDGGEEEGPFGPTYNIACAWRLTGPIDEDRLARALEHLVERHESLRTTLVRSEGGYQVIHPPTAPELSVLHLARYPVEERDTRAEELVQGFELRPQRVDSPPLLRAVLGRFDAVDSVLVLVAHHTVADEWSMQLLIRDLSALYGALTAGGTWPAPAPQYRDFLEWELNRPHERLERAREYWRRSLRDARLLPMPTDHPRSAGLPKATAWHRFTIDAQVTEQVLELARSHRSSAFMVLLTAYNVLLYRQTASTDIVVPTFASGRNQAEFHETVGAFFNFVPLRTDIEGCLSYRDVLERTRRTCLDSYRYELPFPEVMAEAPNLMATASGDRAAPCAFQVFQSAFVADDPEGAGGLRYRKIQRKTLSQDSGTDIPDGAMLQLEISADGEMVGNLGHNTNLFTARSARERVDGFRRALSDVLRPDAPLR
ncbi:MAG TPA: condensation domain-containing protein [Nocardiopsis listeri]|uniref:condensation domain-containing protein n=1 Tax=Nocardiopsis listeri TaxID=53440 RepID=UPI001D7E7001|nr:condensation domain-containing protein [Nocardiopsis listeri]HJE59654.1 condensation domain-containing protein [Nocardiopsis listeri]